MRTLWRDKRGVTGLETAIILIAFVVVASVFAFTILSTGVLATEKTKETVLGGLEETGGSLALRGSIIALATTSPSAYVETVKFQVTTAVRTGSAVNMATSSVIVTYVDEDQAVNMAAADWTPTWLAGGTGILLDAGERVEIVIDLTGLSPKLSARKEFTIRIQPSKGAVLTLTRTTPAELTAAFELR